MQTTSSIYKLLLDENRLKILGCLAYQPSQTDALIKTLDLKPAAVMRHLSLLQEAGLVSTSSEGLHQLDLNVLLAYKESAFAGQDDQAGHEDLTPEEKALRGFLEGDRIKVIPAKTAKLHLVLAWLVDKFEPDVRYPEKRVNEIIQNHHPDYASWRRWLVDYGLMNREKGIYWRSEDPSDMIAAR